MFFSFIYFVKSDKSTLFKVYTMTKGTNHHGGQVLPYGVPRKVSVC